MLELKRNPKAVLLLYLLYTVAAFIVIALSLYWLGRLRSIGVQDSGISFMSTILQSIFAVSVALTSAIATIYLAVMGVNLVENQSRRDYMENASSFVNAANKPFLELVVAQADFLDAIQMAYNQLRFQLSDLVRQKGSLDMYALEEIIQPTLEQYVPQLIDRLGILESAVLKLWSSPEAVALCRTVESRSRYSELIALINEEKDERINFYSGPSTVLQCLRGIRIHLLAGVKKMPYIPFSIGLFRAVDCFNDSSFPESLKLTPGTNFFLQACYVLTPYIDDQQVNQGRPALNFGAAIMLDIADLVPTADEILAFLNDRFSSISEQMLPAISSYVLASSPSDALGHELKHLSHLDAEKFLIGSPMSSFRTE